MHVLLFHASTWKKYKWTFWVCLLKITVGRFTYEEGQYLLLLGIFSQWSPNRLVCTAISTRLVQYYLPVMNIHYDSVFGQVQRGFRCHRTVWKQAPWSHFWSMRRKSQQSILCSGLKSAWQLRESFLCGKNDHFINLQTHFKQRNIVTHCITFLFEDSVITCQLMSKLLILKHHHMVNYLYMVLVNNREVSISTSPLDQCDYNGIHRF